MISRDMRATIVCLLLLGYGSSGVCQTPSKQFEWKEYVYPSAGFAIALPSDPFPHDDPTNPGYTVYTVHVSPTLVVTFRSANRQDCVTILNDARNAARSTGLCRRKVLSIRVSVARRAADATIREADTEFLAILDCLPIALTFVARATPSRGGVSVNPSC
jgi:hypothetical protein